MESIVIVGFGGHAKSIADCIERDGRYSIVGYTDIEDNHTSYKYLGTDDMLQDIYNSGVKNAVIGVGYLGKGTLRQELYRLVKSIGYEMPIIKDPSAIVSDSACVGEGTFIGKLAVINAEANVGKMTIINTKALIEHECNVGDYTHVAVGAILCGQVNVGKSVLIGANSTILQCRTVESNTIVPAGITVR